MEELDVARLRADYNGPHELVKTSDSKTLFVRRWLAMGEARVSVLILHGITGYSGPYGKLVADELADAGVDVFGLDLRGHGLSDGTRGDYPSEERLVSDLAETIALVKSKSSKLVLMGHSLGVLAAVAALNNRPGDVAGFVSVSMARKVNVGVYPKPKTGAMLWGLLGVAIFRGTPVFEYRREGQLGLDDPLFDFHYSARFYSVLYGTGALKVIGMMRSGVVNSPNLGFKEKLRIPLFVAVGDKDELFSVAAVKEFYESINCEDKEFHVIPGARHAVFPKGSWGPLVDWLGKRF